MTDRDRATRVFRALADSTRLRIVRLLARNQTQACVCEFVDVLQERQYNVSRHLKSLENAGLITGEKDGQWTYYGLSPDNDAVLSGLCDVIGAIADQDRVFRHDQRRFNARMKLRRDGRCRIGIRSEALKGSRSV